MVVVNLSGSHQGIFGGREARKHVLVGFIKKKS